MPQAQQAQQQDIDLSAGLVKPPAAQAAPAIDLSAGLVQPKQQAQQQPQPSQAPQAAKEIDLSAGLEQPQSKPLIPPDATISRGESPSWWERFKNMFAAGAPSGSALGSGINLPDWLGGEHVGGYTGSEQYRPEMALIHPEEAMTPTERDSIVGAPIAAAGKLVSGFTTPGNVLLAAATLGESDIPETINALGKAYFGATGIMGAVQSSPQVAKAVAEHNWPEAEKQIVNMAGSLGIAAMAGKEPASPSVDEVIAQTVKQNAATGQPIPEPQSGEQAINLLEAVNEHAPESAIPPILREDFAAAIQQYDEEAASATGPSAPALGEVIPSEFEPYSDGLEGAVAEGLQSGRESSIPSDLQSAGGEGPVETPAVDTGAAPENGAAIPAQEASAASAERPDEAGYAATGGEAAAQAGQQPAGGLGTPAAAGGGDFASRVAELSPAERIGVTAQLLSEANRLATETTGGIPLKISDADRRALSLDGIHVQNQPRDLGIIARFLGSVTQQVRRVNPVAGRLADLLSNVTTYMSRGTEDSLQRFSNAYTRLKGGEWEHVVKLLDDPAITQDSLPADLSSREKLSYSELRSLLDEHRNRMIAARRAGDAAGFKQDAILARTPDDWGRNAGYFPHTFLGDWTVHLMETDPDTGQVTYTPIETNYRATTLQEAIERAQGYKQAHPDAELSVQLDNFVMPSTGAGTLAKLRALANSIRQTSKLEGEQLEDAIGSLQQQSAAAAFAPQRTAARQFGHALQREANLPGWLTTPEAFEAYIRGAERYITLVENRPTMMNLRNSVASEFGITAAAKPSELNRFRTDSNLVGRLDGAIQAVEGYPNWIDGLIRNKLQRMGFDPMIADRAQRFIMQIEALAKLGYSPISAITVMAHTMALTYPVLGEKYTALGIMGALDTLVHESKWDGLTDRLALDSRASRIDTESFDNYMHNYLPTTKEGATGLIAGPLRAFRDVGMFAFTKAKYITHAVAAIGAYQKGLDMNMNELEATHYAQQILDRTQISHHPFDKPELLQFLPKPIGQFKNFAFRYFETMTSLRGAEIPRFIAATAALGIISFPAINAINSLLSHNGKGPLDYAKQAHPKLVRGIPGLLGADITHNVGFADVATSGAFSGNKLLGPAGSDIDSFIKWIAAPSDTRSQEEFRTQFLRGISPEYTRLSDEGTRIAARVKGGPSSLLSTELRDPKTGALILRDLSPYERTLMIMGITPLRVAEARDFHSLNASEKLLLTDQKEFYVDKLANMRLRMADPSLTDGDRLAISKEALKLYEEIKGNKQIRLSDIQKDAFARAKSLRQEQLERDVKQGGRLARPETLQHLQQLRNQ